MNLDFQQPPISERRASVTASAEWRALRAHAVAIGTRHLRQLFIDDEFRGERLAGKAAGLYLDYSKNRITDETILLLIELGTACGLPQRIEVLTADEPLDVVSARLATFKRMARFCQGVRSGEYTGYGGKRIRNVITIGAADLGPEMAFEALRFYTQRDLNFRFISAVDGTDFIESVRDLDAAETLFILCFRSFSLAETLLNARAAQAWCVSALGSPAALSKHFVAVSAQLEEAQNFGVDADYFFNLEEGLRGGYSLASALGVSTMLAIGADNFSGLLDGFQAMDRHFRTASAHRNLPILHGLLAIWNSNFLHAATLAIVPFEQYLKRFPAYLQQLGMGSNGKRVTRDGIRVDYHTAPIYWGEPGSHGQHSFYQMLHYGTRLVPCDFIGFCQALNPLGEQHDVLIANLFAQSEGLAFGPTADQEQVDGRPEAQVSQRIFNGNRPSNTILAERLTPHSLGALMALYEHSVFVQGAIWNIDPSDQWGVELSEHLSKRTRRELASVKAPQLEHDSSTNALIRHYRHER